MLFNNIQRPHHYMVLTLELIPLYWRALTVLVMNSISHRVLFLLSDRSPILYVENPTEALVLGVGSHLTAVLMVREDWWTVQLSMRDDWKCVWTTNGIVCVKKTLIWQLLHLSVGIEYVLLETVSAYVFETSHICT